LLQEKRHTGKQWFIDVHHALLTLIDGTLTRSRIFANYCKLSPKRCPEQITWVESGTLDDRCQMKNSLTKYHRNAAKARVKDTTGRLEKSFFGQRRLCAASQAMGRNNIPSEESLGGANISLGHAKRKIPPNDVITGSFIPSPIDLSPSTPHSRRRTKKRLESHSSSSNVGRSKVLDALDVSERQSTFESGYMRFLIQLCSTAMFIRQVLDRILTMPDLAGISKNRTKPTVGTERQPQPGDESSPLQQTKRKVKSKYRCHQIARR
jgi:hypothetical protein